MDAIHHIPFTTVGLSLEAQRAELVEQLGHLARHYGVAVFYMWQYIEYHRMIASIDAQLLDINH